MSGTRVRGRDALLATGATVLGIAAILLPWTLVANCPNTDVARGFAETTDPFPWVWIYVVGFTGTLGAVLLPGRRGALVAALSAAAALVGTGAIAADLSAPFEAMRPRPGLPPVGVLCEMKDGPAMDLAVVGCVLASVAAWRRVDLRVGWASRRLAGAVVVGGLNVMLSWPWVLVVVDAVTDTTSDRPSTDGGLLLSVALAAIGALAAWFAWPGIGGRRMVVRGLLVVGAFALVGPLVLLGLRLAGLGRTGAAVLAPWSGAYGVIPPLFVAGIAVWGAVLIAVGASLARGPRA